MQASCKFVVVIVVTFVTYCLSLTISDRQHSLLALLLLSSSLCRREHGHDTTNDQHNDRDNDVHTGCVSDCLKICANNDYDHDHSHANDDHNDHQNSGRSLDF